MNYTKYEKTRIIGARALQISMGAPLFVKVTKEDKSPLELAERELALGLIPIDVRH